MTNGLFVVSVIRSVFVWNLKPCWPLHVINVFHRRGKTRLELFKRNFIFIVIRISMNWVAASLKRDIPPNNSVSYYNGTIEKLHQVNFQKQFPIQFDTHSIVNQTKHIALQKPQHRYCINAKRYCKICQLHKPRLVPTNQFHCFAIISLTFSNLIFIQFICFRNNLNLS